MTLRRIWDKCVCTQDEWGAIKPCLSHQDFLRTLGYPLYEPEEEA